MPIRTKLRPLSAIAVALGLGIASSAHAATFTVTHIGDSGAGSLRQAILDANANPGADTIQFNLGAIASPPTYVNLLTPLPAIAGDVSIIGPGPGQVIVQVDPVTNPAPFPIFSVTGAPTVEIRGLAMSRGGGTDGAGVLAQGGSLTVRECWIFENIASNSGGAIAMIGAGNASLTIRDCVLLANASTNFGGAVSVVRTSGAVAVTVSGTTLGHNTITGLIPGHTGGGLHVSGGAGPHTVTISNSTISDNAISVDGNGGGVFVDALGGTVSVVNTTIAGNNCGTGSALSWSHAAMSVLNCTITANNCYGGPFESPLLDVNGGGMTVKNTILSGNIAGAMFRDMANGQLGTGNNNLVGLGGPFVNGQNGNIVGVFNPRLVPLKFNGGINSLLMLQPLTFALQPDSPALDAGSNADAPPADERGQPRPADGDNNGTAIADIGAFETQRYLVTSTSDSSAGSLRQAIDDNNAAGGGFIKFAIPTLGQRQTIAPATALPPLMRTAFIDAWSQGGLTYQGPPLIEIDGAGVTDGAGLDIRWSDCIVRGLSINNFGGFGMGVRISTSAGQRNWIYGCYIGVRPDGVTDRGNGQFGIWISPAANSNTIGTNADGIADAFERNVISGSRGSGLKTGVYIESNSNIIAGNNIGTDVTGQIAVPNFNGVWVSRGSSNQLGTTQFSMNQAAERNTISGNQNAGVSFTSQGSNNFISGNDIGMTSTGGAALPNGIGVVLDDVNRTLVGGTSPGERNVISGNLQQGVIVSGANAYSNLIQGNYIGTNPAGTAAVPNALGGVLLRAGVTFCRIGAFGDGSFAETGRRNVISGNGGAGVVIQDASSTDNRVMGNYIGVAADGRTPLGNQNAGVSIVGSGGNRVGATATGRNIIGAQTSTAAGDGVTITGVDAAQNFVQNNLIGVGVDGSASGNRAAGVSIRAGAAGNMIGGTQPGEGNTIWNSVGTGVRVIDDDSLTNAILGNSILSSGRLGIDLKDDGVTPNGPANVVRVGPNTLQNYPVLQSALPNGVITATLAAKAATFYRIEYFSSASQDPSGFGEGRTFLGARTVLTDISGNVGPFTFATIIPPGEGVISATATELLPLGPIIRGFPTQPGAPLGTSEFSQNVTVNTAPTTSDQAASTSEDVDALITLSAIDPDPATTLTFRVQSLPATGQLLQFGSLDPIVAPDTAVTDPLGRVLFRPQADQFGSPYATFTFLANDGLADSNTSRVTVNVTPAADTPSVTDASTREDVQTTSGLVISRNPVDGPEVTHFKITAIAAGTLYQNDGATPIINGQIITVAQGNAGLKFTPAPNFNGVATFNVQAAIGNTDAGIGGSAVTAHILVSPVADQPAVTDATTREDTQSSTGLVISRNAADGPEVTHFKVSALTAGQLFQNDGVTPIGMGQFITAAQGAAGLKYTPPADFNGLVTFQVQASLSTSDSGLGGPAATGRITVTPVNDPPTFTAANPPAVLEDSGSVSVANWATNFIPGPPDESTQTNLGYTVSGVTNPALFSVLPTVDLTGTLRYTPAANANGTSQLTVVVRDSGGTADGGIDTSTPRSFTISVTPVNDAPTFVAANPPAVLEDAGPMTVSGWAGSFNPGPPDEASQTNLGYTVSTVTNTALFSAPPTVDLSGTLRYTPAPNANGTSQFTVTVRDSGGTATGGVDTSSPQTFTITVLAVNDAPTFSASTPAAVLEDSGPAVVTNWATSFVPGPPDEASQTVLGYTVSGVTNPSLFAALPTVDSGGTLRYTPAPDANGTSLFTVVVRDNGGTANGGVDTSAPQTFTITVRPVNDPPTFAATNPPPSLEDSGPVTLAGWAGAFNPGPPDEAAQTNLGYMVSGITNPALFSAPPTVALDGTLQYTPAPDANGSSQFTVAVRDSGGTADGGIDTSLPRVYTIVISPVNDAPTFTAANPPAVLEDAGSVVVPGWVTNFNPGPPDEASQTVLGYTVSSITNPALFSAAPTVDAMGTLRYTPAPDANGTSQFTVVVRDSGGTTNGGVDTSAPQTFTITVAPVNDKPSFTASNPPAVLEGSGSQIVAGYIASFNPGPPDEAGQTIAEVIVDQVSNPALFTVLPSVSPTRQLTYTVAPSGYGTSTFRVRLRDSGGTSDSGIDLSDPQTFTLVVRPAAVCQDVTIDARTNCVPLTVQPSQINHTPADPGPGATQSVTFSRPLTSPFPLGITPVVMTVRYSDGLISTCVARVTVQFNDCNANGIPDSCETGLGGSLQDCNGDSIPDDCQCLWDDGMIAPADAPTANGQLSHYGAIVAAKVADDFYLEPGRMYRLLQFKGQMITNTFFHKAILEFYEDCDGRPAATPFKTFENSIEESVAPAGPGFVMVTVGFDLCSECFYLEGGKSYWVSLVGRTDFANSDDVSYWVTTTPLSNPANVMGMPPVKRDGVGGPPPYPVTYNPWQPTNGCCIGCVNMAWRLTGEGCQVAWDNGAIDLGANAGGSPSDLNQAIPYLPRTAENFYVGGCDPVPVCYLETYIWSNCNPLTGFAEIYRNDCNAPEVAPVLTATATRVVPIPGPTVVYQGQTLKAYRLEFCNLAWTLEGSKNYWLSTGAYAGNSLSGRALFAYAKRDCALSCGNIRLSPGRTLDHSALPLQWTETTHEHAFRLAVRGSMGLMDAAPIVNAAPACTADFNRDRELNAQDIFDFLTAWFSGCP